MFKQRSWVQSSFSNNLDIKEAASDRKVELKRKKNFSNLVTANNEVLWVEKYAPKTKSELAVHSKKISEIELWLKQFQEGKPKKSSILLLTGPSGVGKTASVYALASDMGFEVREWINPLSQHSSKLESFPYENQATIFWDFVMKTSKYNSLELQGNCSKLILIEDFPNVFLKNPEEFHNLMRKLHKLQRCPFVFILSDTKSAAQARCLFPTQLQQELSIQTISFNAVAPTIMMKVLQKIAAAELGPASKKNNLESLIELSSGDIRLAINSLQFTYSGLQKQRSNSITTKKVKRNDEKLQSPSSSKDVSYHIFRALGKVLHCKRVKDVLPIEEQLSHHLKCFARSPLIEKPEDIVDNACLSSEALVLFLQQNYLAFFHDIDEALNAAKYISDTDILNSEWSDQNILQECSALIAVRGLMHSNCSGGNIGWQPLYKPYYFSAFKMIREALLIVQQLCPAYRLSASEIVTEILPYKCLTRSPAKSSDEACFMKDFCSYSRNQYLRSSEVLDKNEFVDSSDVINEPNYSEDIPQLTTEIDDEIIIDDFDDD